MKCFFIGTVRVRTQSVGVASGSENSHLFIKLKKPIFASDATLSKLFQILDTVTSTKYLPEFMQKIP